MNTKNKCKRLFGAAKQHINEAEISLFLDDYESVIAQTTEAIERLYIVRNNARAERQQDPE